jgi:hypothetical protein
VISWAPSINDWYETVKLNYGHDFTQGRATGHLPGPDSAPSEVPKTWRTMDEVLTYWQEMGVNGFRADMAHLVPMAFWRWAVKRARARQTDVFFSAEAYDNDPAKLSDGHMPRLMIYSEESTILASGRAISTRSPSPARAFINPFAMRKITTKFASPALRSGAVSA